MAYPFPSFYGQPYQYQDQLTQLRGAAMSQPQSYQQPIRTDPGMNWVQGETGAKSWFVAPGATVLLMDSESQRFYLKTADMNGVPSMRVFEYHEAGSVAGQQPTQQPRFVTMEEFNAFKTELAGRLEKPVAEKGDAHE